MAEKLTCDQFEQSFRELKKEMSALQRKEARLAETLTDFEKILADSVRNLEVTIERLQQEIADRDQKLHTLEQSELRWRALIKRIGHPMALYDRKGKILLMNESGARNIEGSPDDFVGKSILDLFPDKGDVYLKRISKAFRTGSSEEYEDEVSLPSGKRWFTSVYEPVTGLDDELFAVQIASVDITGHKRTEERLRESEERFRSLFENSHDGIFLTSPDGKVFAANPSACRMFERTEAELCELGREGVVDSTDPRLSVALEVRKRTGRFKGELTFLRRNGQPFPVELTSVEFRDKDGQDRTSMIVRDITERKKMEHAAERQRAFLRQVIDADDNLIFVKDKESRYVLVNKGLADAYGTTTNRMEGKTDVDLGASPEEAAKYRKDDRQVLESGRTKLIPEEKFTWASGEVHYYQTTKYPLEDESGAHTNLLAVSVDITERKRTEEALRDSEILYRSLVSASPDAIGMIDLDGSIRFASDKALEVFGLSSAEVIGRSVLNWVAPEEHEKVQANIQHTLTEGYPKDKEYTLVKKDGTRFIGEVNAAILRSTDDHIKGMVVVVRDVTEHNQVEEALRESEARFSTIFHSSPVATAISRLKDNHLMDVNKAWQKATGLTREEAIDHTPAELNIWANSSDRDRLISKLYEQRMVRDFEFQVRHKSGNIYDMLMSAELIELGGEQHVLTLAQDITRRKQAEKALQESENRYRLFVENANDAIFVAQDGRIAFANLKTEDLLGYPVRELKELSIVEWIHPDDRETVLDRFTRRLKPEQPSTNYSLRIIRKGGEERWVSVNSVGIDWEGKPATLSFVRDITEQRQAEAHLQQVQKMESLGTMVAGLAHEINNPVNCILINAPLLGRIWEDILQGVRDYAERNPESTYGGLTFPYLEKNLAQLISDMGLGADRISKLVGALKNFARRPDTIKKEPVDINRAVENALNLSRSTVEKSGIELDVEYGQNLPEIEGHLESVEQILLNLILNSAQAIHHEKGKIRVTASFQDSTKKIWIVVEDNGEGMDPSVASKIFDPFFTTKQMEGGGGLGLFVTYNLVKELNGDITFQSRKGAGTVFRIAFPLEKSEKMARILVVDDDERILGLLSRALDRHPIYIVETARDGMEALIKLGTFKPDVLILDIFMPGMDGIELCRRLQSKLLLSALKVIIMTGQVDNPRLGELKEMGIHDIYSKPFDVEDIMKGVSEALTRKG